MFKTQIKLFAEINGKMHQLKTDDVCLTLDVVDNELNIETDDWNGVALKVVGYNGAE